MESKPKAKPAAKRKAATSKKKAAPSKAKPEKKPEQAEVAKAQPATVELDDFGNPVHSPF